MSEPKPENNFTPPNVPAKASDAQSTSSAGAPPPVQLSKEERWALFEKELKESDWGHQPC